MQCSGKIYTFYISFRDFRKSINNFTYFARKNEINIFMLFPKIYLNIFQILEEERERGDEEDEEREMGVKNEELGEVDAVPSRSVSVAGAVKRFIASLTS